MIRRAAIAAVAAVTVVAAGCSSTPTLSEAPPNEYFGLEIPAGRVGDAVKKLDGLAERVLAESRIPGLAVVVVHGGETLYANGFGVRSVDGVDGGDMAENQVGADTVFQLGSLSTAVGATVVANQVGENVVDWDTPISVFLPWFTLSDPYASGHVTVADLFAGRAGLPARAGDRLADLGYNRRQVLERLRELPLAGFRSGYTEAGFGVTAAAEAVAVAAGKPWEQLCADVLYRPLQMASTGSRYTDYTGRADRATGHVRDGAGYRPSYRGDHDAVSAAAGVSSSVNDMARWLTMMLDDGRYDGRQVISADALTPAVTAQAVAVPTAAPSARGVFRGYGFQVDVTSSGRAGYGGFGGSGSGVSGGFAILPSADVGIIVLTNAEPVGVPETLIGQFLDLVQYNEIREDWAKTYRLGSAASGQGLDQGKGMLSEGARPAAPVRPGPLRGYTGEYGNDFWGPARVTETQGGLELSLGPGRQKLPLTHWDADTFTFEPRGDNVPPGTLSTAVFTPDTVTLAYYDGERLGMFFR